MEPYVGKGYNITTDNFFTSKRLAMTLKIKRITIVGTVRKNRKEIPPNAMQGRKELHATDAYVSETADCLLCVYQSKPSKSVAILSTFNDVIDITDGPKRKPNTIVFYNHNKVGVDIVEEMARKLTTKVPCRRWPVNVFFNVLDLGCINAWILYKSLTNRKISHQNFSICKRFV
jgi:hypothetical protein